jgi:fructose-1,6-bisphosphatase/inositol monophosphatase family enzyme
MIAMPWNELERGCLDVFRSRAGAPSPGELQEKDWVAFGIHILLEAGRLIRSLRLAPEASGLDFKGDGSPATLVEREVETLLRNRLAEFAPDTAVLGEETGGTLPAEGLAVAMDPIDGTWAFLGRTETFCTTLAAFRDGQPFLGLIGSAATGEIAYSGGGKSARLLQLAVFGESDIAQDLPLPRIGSAGALVNVHPAAAAGPLVESLYTAWKARDVRMVRSPGGSPSWALLEAAKGTFAYVNLWSRRPAEPYDLAAGTLLVRGAGGDVVDIEGVSIDPVQHEGPFVAAVDADVRDAVVSLTRAAVGQDD